MSASRTPPWRQPAKDKTSDASAPQKLTPESVAWARARALAAGRRYPNLVDNLAAARRQRAAAASADRHLDHP